MNNSTAIVWRVSFSLNLVWGTFIMLASRYVTLQRTSALRLLTTQSEFNRLMKDRKVLSVNQMEGLFLLQLVTVTFANLPLMLSKVLKGNAQVYAQAVEASMGWFWVMCNICLIVLCCIRLIKEEKIGFEFTEGVGDNDVPLEALKISNEDKEWRKVASTSRQHGVYVRRTASSEFEVTTCPADVHSQTRTPAPVLCITL